MAKEHHYNVTIKWEDNSGRGTADPALYDRSHAIFAEGKPAIKASADPSSKGDAAKWNPEELLVGSLSSCHMLWYLYLCSVQGVVVTEYSDEPLGVLSIDASGKGKFNKVQLHPKVVVESEEMAAKAEKLHTKAHEMCFVSNSVNFPVEVKPEIDVTGVKD